MNWIALNPYYRSLPGGPIGLTIKEHNHMPIQLHGHITTSLMGAIELNQFQSIELIQFFSCPKNHFNITRGQVKPTTPRNYYIINFLIRGIDIFSIPAINGNAPAMPYKKMHFPLDNTIDFDIMALTLGLNKGAGRKGAKI